MLRQCRNGCRKGDFSGRYRKGIHKQWSVLLVCQWDQWSAKQWKCPTLAVWVYPRRRTHQRHPSVLWWTVLSPSNSSELFGHKLLTCALTLHIRLNIFNKSIIVLPKLFSISVDCHLYLPFPSVLFLDSSLLQSIIHWFIFGSNTCYDCLQGIPFAVKQFKTQIYFNENLIKDYLML